MRAIHGTVRHGGLILLMSLTMACNAILGVEDVAALSPDAGPTRMCDVAPDFSRLVSDSSSLLTRTSDNEPALLIELSTDSKPDSLGLVLFDGMGGHGTLNAPGMYAITAGDASLATCGICLEVDANFDSGTKSSAQTFWADAQGTLTISRADATGLAGRLQDLRFRQVNIANGNTTDVSGGCTVTVEDVQFDMTYSSGASAARPGRLVR